MVQKQRERARSREERESKTIEDLRVDVTDRVPRESFKAIRSDLDFAEPGLPKFIRYLMDNRVQTTMAIQLVKSKEGFSFKTEAAGAGEPLPTGARASTTSTSYVDAFSYTVPAGKSARLDEIAVAGDSNGLIQVKVKGSTYASDIEAQKAPSFPFNGGFLKEGDTIEIQHKSKDGSSTVTNGTISLRLF